MIYIRGAASSVFIIDYIEHVGSSVPIILLNTDKEYYNSITVLRKFSPLWWYSLTRRTQNIVLKAVFYFLVGLSIGRKEIIHIHFLDGIPDAFIFLGAWIRGAKRIITFWGSDLYLKEQQIKFFFRKLTIRLATKISLSTDEMVKRFQEKYKLRVKIYKTRFALPIIEEIKKKAVGFSPRNEKIFVKVGYCARAQQQHIPILLELKKLPADIKSQIKLLLPLSYGRNSEVYLNELREISSSLGVEVVLIEEFLPKQEIACSILSTDIFINLPETDAQSASLQEHLYAGSVVITGSWLPYKGLQARGGYFYSIGGITQLIPIFKSVIKNLDSEKDKALRNKDLIYKLSSWDSVRHQWLKLYQ